jgi:glycosyltransferase involved in cell wall biosynthesis
LKRLTLIPIGSNIAPIPPFNYDRPAWRAKLGIAPDEILLSYFGFLNESKGGTDLVRALAQIPNAKLIMVGGQVGASDPTNVAYLAQVKNLIEEFNLHSRVIWTDYADASIVSANLLASDICILPYRDGASFRRGSFMAALAHGLPIITTTDNRRQTADMRSSLLPQLRDGENVLLVPIENPTALAETITRLAASSELRARLGQGARALAENFTWDKIAAQHLDLYNRLLAQ